MDGHSARRLVASARLVCASLFLVHTALAQTPPTRDSISDSVGATLGEFRVDESGGASYAVPIYAPPGTAGVVPKLSLVYNSAGGVGPLGKGWSIGGTSAISRCRMTREHGDFFESGQLVDGNPVPISLTNTDAFCLDGQRLLKTAGNAYGDNGAEYRLELDPYTRVYSINGNNSSTANYTGPESFKVQRKDGSTTYYGNTEDSRIEGGVTLAIASWAMNRFEDSTGNYIDYAYVERPGASFAPVGVEYVISSVTYTGKRALPNQSASSAPYAGIYFSYRNGGLQPVSGEETGFGYVAGTAFSQTQVLESITVKDQIDTSPRSLRFYKLCYGTTDATCWSQNVSSSGSKFKQLRSIKECRDSTEAVCYRPTKFRWSDIDGVGYRMETETTAAGSGTGKQVGASRVGDLDGDGRADILWYRRGDPTCAGGSRLRVAYGSLATSNGSTSLSLEAPDSPYVAQQCTTLDASNGELNTAIQLLDFNGDGRDDLAIADNNGPPGARWHVYASVGRPTSGGQPFDFSTDLMGSLVIPTADDSQDQAQFGDYNGDGLIDVLYPYSSTELRLRFFERSGSTYAFGPEYVIDNSDFMDNCPGCEIAIQNQTDAGLSVAGDLNGDGRADLVLQVTVPALVLAQQPEGLMSRQFYAFTMDAKNASAGSQTIKQYGGILHTRNDVGPQQAADFQFADFNGDGLADLWYTLDASEDDYSVKMNSGNGFPSLPPSAGFNKTVYNIQNRSQLQLIDVTGDGRADVVYPAGDTPCPGTLSTDHVFRVRSLSYRWGIDGQFQDASDVANADANTPCIPGGGAKGGVLTDARFFFADFDGDGALDFVKLRDFGPTTSGGASTPQVTTSRAIGSRFAARDTISEITNGHGATTTISYQPLTNKAVYRRDRDSRTGPLRGRGSPVVDVLSSTYVVTQVSSSAPIAGNAAARSTILYRYTGAKAQSGGRGSLGFAKIETFDANPVDGGWTGTEQFYRQEFPMAGSALATNKWIFTGSPTRGTAALDACASNPEANGQDCFYNPGDSADYSHPTLGTGGLNGKMVRFSATLWSCKDGAGTEVCTLDSGASPNACPDSGYTSAPLESMTATQSPLSAYVPSSAATVGAQQPLFVYSPRTVDVEFDPADGSVTRHVCGLFQYGDGYGNATRTEVATFSNGTAQTGAKVASKITTNVFLNDASNWRLSRLLTSEIRDQRGGVSRYRYTDFEYEVDQSGVYTSPTDTGLLKSERVQKSISSAQDLRTLYTLDEYGNRLEAYTCSQAEYDGSTLTDSECRDKTRVQQRPVASDGPTTAVHRYALNAYDSRGRYLTETRVPYFSPSAARNVNEQVSLSIGARDEFGNATTRTDANGLVATTAFGALNRAYYAADATGKASTTTFRWCGTGTNEVSCPPNASFRQQTVTAGAPKAFAYYDILGREMMKVAESFNVDGSGVGISGKNWSATCTTYDSHNRGVYASIPFFLGTSYGIGSEPVFSAANPCSGVAGTSTTFDVLGRARLVTAPDNTSVQTTFSRLTTIATDSRGQQSAQIKNALGEVVTVVQADKTTGQAINPSNGQPVGMVVSHAYDEQGNLRFVTRNAGQGDIVSEVQYDALGRKTAVIDPDRGTTSYTYNAAGEVIQQIDARNNRVEFDYDALGRMWRRRFGASFVFDMPPGVLFRDSFEGTSPGPGEGSQDGIVTDIFQYDAFCDGNSTDNLGLLVFEERDSASYVSCESTRHLTGLEAIVTPMGNATMEYRAAVVRDTYGRPITKYTAIRDVAGFFEENYTYDSFDRPSTTTDASRDTQTTIYSARGYVKELRYSLAAVGTSGLFYEVLEHDAWGHVLRERRNGTSNMETTRTFHPQRGWLESICSGTGCTIQNLEFDFDSNGNLLRRERLFGPREDFVYDKLNRLTTISRSGSGTTFETQSITHDALGNICSKGPSGSVVSYTYFGRDGCNASELSGSPHAVKSTTGPNGTVTYSYDSTGNQNRADASGTADDRYVEYDVLDQAVFYLRGSITSPTGEGDFHYSPGKTRYRRIDRAGGQTTTTVYMGSVEIISRPNATVEMKRYLGGAAIVATFSNQPGVVQDRYSFTDHLGSVDVIVSDAAAVVEQSSFDAWGGRRNPGSWSGTGTALTTTTRGYTGHEHVDIAGFVHMNGRVYDPVLGRFMQADPMIDAGIQGLNRYTYVLNNPLSYTDPTGYLTWGEWMRIAISTAVAVGTGGIGGWQGYAAAGANGFMAGAVQSGSLKGGAWGAFSAVAFHGIGSYFESANAGWARNGAEVFNSGLDAGGYAAKVLAHGVVGGTMNYLQGSSFGSGFASAGLTQAASGAIGLIDPSNPIGRAERVVVAALIGGTASKLTGGKFAHGAVTAAFSRAFNDEVHRSSPKSSLETAREKGEELLAPYVSGYDLNDPNYHRYATGPTDLCTVGDRGCSFDMTAPIAASKSVPFAAWYSGRGSYNLPDLDFPWVVGNPIQHSTPASGVWRNVTLAGHRYHPGSVVHGLYESGGRMWLYTIGNL